MSKGTIGKPLYLRVRVKGNILCDFFSSYFFKNEKKKIELILIGSSLKKQ
jgi:hypothetical protein